MARRLKNPPAPQLSLFDSPTNETIASFNPKRSTEPELAKDRPFAAPARDAEFIQSSRGEARYVGFVTQQSRTVCRVCLERDGAQRSLAGGAFLRYLWAPLKDAKGKSSFKVHSCDVCGATFSAEVM